ncbi:MAG: alpha-D-ribose 1-methylphosphonate 5-triphosphate diphosphatase [Amaricoccus sp.]|uniref:alpha-D-ribose 1-methylphosphonate 5-triphosphate diphosphatase n=1 Tax=Amaricoccus sp. TaxID=1872485 RepID=UPI0039E6E26B
MTSEAMPYDSRTAQPGEIALANARLVLAGETRPGSVLVRDGQIVAVNSGAAVPRGALDCEGDLLVPGLIELHTDNLERHLEPRPGVAWPHGAAIAAHDAELAGCGITTVFDALRVGSLVSGRERGYAPYARALASEIDALRRAGALRLSHRLHLRAETCSETLTEELAAFGPEDEVGILSLMDHTPGQRQFRDLAALRVYTRGRRTVTDAEFDALVAERLEVAARFREAHEAAAVAAARRLGATLASHDDTTPAQVAVSAGHGSRIAEFPTTTEAALACRRMGIAVMMGAPNLLRGGSHSGNAAAMDLAEAGLLDILSSDYAPASLLLAAVRLGEAQGDLAAGFATVTTAPAMAAGLADRGRIAPGLRADLLRVRLAGGLPLPCGVWVAGDRVA